VLGIALLAYLLALNPENKVLDLVAWAWAGFGAAFGPAIVLSLYWPRMTRNGALAGMLVGGATVILWKQGSGGIFALYEMVPGVMLSTLAIWVTSWLDRRPR
jgi:sodium/proline symporter